MAKTNGQGKLIVFDHDGVIADSMSEVFLTTRDVLEETGVSTECLPDFPTFLQTFAMPWHDFYRSYGVTESNEELQRRFLKIFPTYEDLITPYLGMSEVVKELWKRGWRMAIVSAADTKRVKHELERFGFQDLFAAVYASRQSKVEMIGDCCWHLDVVPEGTFYVGDLPSDMRDARAAGVIPVGFAANYDFMRPALKTAGAVTVIDEPEELVTLVLQAGAAKTKEALVGA